jgi:hypothetical protein
MANCVHGSALKEIFTTKARKNEISKILKNIFSCVYSGCQKNVPIAERFFATTLMPPSFFRNINMTSGIKFRVFVVAIKCFGCKALLSMEDFIIEVET